MNTPFQFVDDNVPFIYDGRERMVLPKQYTPGDDVVIIGRGKRVQQHPANRRFKALIAAQLANYSNAATKGLKSNILWRVLREVRSYSKSRLGFVKRDSETGRWYCIDDAAAKINISQAFRDGLHTCYKSSKKNKQQKRKAEMGESEEEGEYKACSSLDHFASRFDASSPPSKRTCFPTNERVPYQQDASDFALGRLGSSMIHRLRKVLATPNISLEPQMDQLSMDLKVAKRSDSWDTFARLYMKFGSHCKFSDDPFEPKPIRTMPLSSQKTNATFVYTAEGAFPNFAMSAMVDETNPPEIGSQGNRQKSSQDVGAVPSLKGAILPSILSLNSLELKDDALSGMNSNSSLSTISDCPDLYGAWDNIDSDRSRNSQNTVTV